MHLVSLWSMIISLLVSLVSLRCDKFDRAAKQESQHHGAFEPSHTSVPFLQGVRYEQDTSVLFSKDEERGPVVLCEARIERTESNGAADPGTNELPSGRFECTELSSLPVASYLRALAPYPERLPTQQLHLALGCGRSVTLTTVVNDTVANHLLRHGVFAPVLTALVSRITAPPLPPPRPPAQDPAAPAAPAAGRPGLVVDLGCNQGLVALIALAHGRAAVCMEPSPHLVPLLADSALRGRFPAPAAVVHAAAAAAWGEVRMAGYAG